MNKDDIATVSSGSTDELANKQAVVLIHGMGEQKPMGTLRDFVETVWTTDGEDRKHWSKPDFSSEIFEVRRLTTDYHEFGPPGSDSEQIRTDFYEFYWADLTQGTAWTQFKDWFLSLLWRPVKAVPKDVLPVWIVLWVLLALVVVISVASLIPADTKVFGVDVWRLPVFSSLRDWPSWQIQLIPAALVFFAQALIVPYFGDVARYVHSAPRNHQTRRAVRERGIKFLEHLHNSDVRYRRIVIVAHSLGTIVAHDLINILWARHNHEFCFDQGRAGEMAAAVHDVNESIDALNGNQETNPDTAEVNAENHEKALKEFRSSQRRYFNCLRKLEKPWLISDLITIGSPLTHADFLMAQDETDLDSRIAKREVLRCPPVRENGTFCYQPNRKTEPSIWQPHHAAAMAAVRWSNIFDQHSWLLFLFGDVISGNVGRHFGNGVEDIRVRIKRGALGIPRLFTHTSYWSQSGKPASDKEPQDQNKTRERNKTQEHIQTLRDTVNLFDRSGDDPAEHTQAQKPVT